MATAQQAINWVAQFINRPGDNGGSYMWKLAGAPGYAGSAWCGATMWADAINNDLDTGPFTLASTIYVPSAVNVAKAHGLWRPSVESKPGDWVCFDWLLSGYRNGLADHIGMVVENDPSKSYIRTIEGNAGAAANGQRCVAYHTRYRVDILGTINRQSAYNGKSAPVTIPKQTQSGHDYTGQDLNQFLSTADVKRIQTILKVTADGLAGPETVKALEIKAGFAKIADGRLTVGNSGAIKKIQARLIQRINANIVIDGILGPKTAAALHTYLAKGGVFTNLHKQSLNVKYKAPAKAPKHAAPAFPLPKGHAYMVNDNTNYSHSGVRGAPDTTNIKKIQSKVGADADGIFGPKTKAKVVAFQKAHKLKADGQVGPATGRAMGLWS